MDFPSTYSPVAPGDFWTSGKVEGAASECTQYQSVKLRVRDASAVKPRTLQRPSSSGVTMRNLLRVMSAPPLSAVASVDILEEARRAPRGGHDVRLHFHLHARASRKKKPKRTPGPALILNGTVSLARVSLLRRRHHLHHHRFWVQVQTIAMSCPRSLRSR